MNYYIMGYDTTNLKGKCFECEYFNQLKTETCKKFKYKEIESL
jgi:predicted ATP-dependent serine protease